MKRALALSALGVGASVRAAPHQQNCFQLNARGPAHGPISQLSDGQIRIGGQNDAATFCFSNTTSIVDHPGRGCILTPSVTQFQCDMGAPPMDGFSLGCGGELSYNGGLTFHACPVNDFDEWNIYWKPAPGQLKCVEITVWATAVIPWWSTSGNCKAPPVIPGSPPPTVNSLPKPEQTCSCFTQCQCPPTQSLYSETSSTPHTPVHTPSRPQTPIHTLSRPQTPVNTPSYPPTPVDTPSQPSTKKQPSPTASITSRPPFQEVPRPSVTSHPRPSTEEQPQPTTSASPYPPVQGYPHPESESACPPGAQCTCDADLDGNYQSPSSIIRIDTTNPTEACSNPPNECGERLTDVSFAPMWCNIFNFQIPSSYQGKTCSLIFLLPHLEPGKGNFGDDWIITMPGDLAISSLAEPGNENTTWQNQPAQKEVLGSIALEPGQGYIIESGECPAGQTIAYRMCSGDGALFDYVADTKSPVGFYMRQC